MGWSVHGWVRYGCALVGLAAVPGCADAEAPGIRETRGALTEAPLTVSLTFDDTLANQFPAAAMLEAHEMRGTFFVNSPRLDRAGSMSLAQVKEMQDGGATLNGGHEIGGHSLGHHHLPELSYDGKRMEVCNDRADLLANGFTAQTFGYPFGDDGGTGSDAWTAIDDCNYNLARDIGGLNNAAGYCGKPPSNTSGSHAESIPPRDRHVVRTPASIGPGCTLDDLMAYVDNARLNTSGPGWIVFPFHNVCDGCSSNAISPALLAQFLGWLRGEVESGRVVVKPMRDVIPGLVEPAVIWNGEGGLLKNAALERSGSVDPSLAHCWQRTGDGLNRYRWERITGRRGSGLRLTISAYETGGRHLTSTQDSGACAPVNAVEGQRFTASAYYRSNTSPVLAVHYRDASGWHVLEESAAGRLPPSPESWASARLTTSAPVPEGATHVSVSLGLRAAGWVEMDDFRLTPR
ncbi:hypothetical protein SOCEGT47_042440 [Sorangium cellulosum]|uniref:NodB homology domain-containing protein n=1 Tax=Sorangium cellulosum TaxID=56 RepID=A0A4P2Q338_SORCE|nr:polysaccharide deacetylase family protein [Sorangium cellulosum]AUX23714.1 hypothetical protein SOCEGT47_042440 [Sorangium cellulosum]